MKQILPLIIFTFFSLLSLHAQQNLHVEDTLVHISLKGNEILKEVNVPVKHIGDKGNINVYWERITNNLPANHISYICDNNLCYGPDLSLCPEDNPNIMEPGYEFNLKLYVERSGLEEGSGLVEILLWEEGKKDQAVKVKYLVNQVNSSSQFSKNALKIYPNPADDYFRIDGVQDITQAIVFNIVGEEMLRFYVAGERSYDISSLNSGIYLVKLVRNNGKIAKTIRISKR